MAKSKFVGPMPEDDAPIPDEVKVERKGTKKSSVPEVSDKDAKSAPKPTRVGATSADREAIILDKTSSRADKRAANRAQVAELDDYIKKMANPGGDDSAPIPTRVDPPKSSGVAKSTPRVGSPSRPNRGAATSSASNRGGSPSPAPSKPAAKPVDSRSKGSKPDSGSVRGAAKQTASVPLAKLKPGATPGPIAKATARSEGTPKSAKPSTPVTKAAPKAGGGFIINPPAKTQNKEIKDWQDRGKFWNDQVAAGKKKVSEEDANSARWKAKYEKPMSDQAKAVGKFMSTPLPGALGNPIKALSDSITKKGKTSKKRPSSSGKRTNRGND